MTDHATAPATSPARPDGWLWRAVAVGVVAGLASGLFGVGGGVVLVPGLVLLAGLDQRMAHGTSLAAIVPIALAGVLGYASGGEVEPVAALLTAVGVLAGTPVGVHLLGRLPERQLRIGFAVVLLASAVRLVVTAGDGAGTVAVDLGTGVLYVLTGLAAGVLAGVMGVGGGVVMVPAFTVLFGMPIVLAKGTSLAVIVPGALLGTVRNRRQGTTDLRLGLVAGLAGVATAALASQVSLGLDPAVASATFAALLLLVVGRMVVRLARDR
jgi:uncharacterized membrane protein YfcA